MVRKQIYKLNVFKEHEVAPFRDNCNLSPYNKHSYNKVYFGLCLLKVIKFRRTCSIKLRLLGSLYLRKRKRQSSGRFTYSPGMSSTKRSQITKKPELQY